MAPTTSLRSFGPPPNPGLSAPREHTYCLPYGKEKEGCAEHDTLSYFSLYDYSIPIFFSSSVACMEGWKVGTMRDVLTLTLYTFHFTLYTVRTYDAQHSTAQRTTTARLACTRTHIR